MCETLDPLEHTNNPLIPTAEHRLEFKKINLLHRIVTIVTHEVNCHFFHPKSLLTTQWTTEHVIYRYFECLPFLQDFTDSIHKDLRNFYLPHSSRHFEGYTRGLRRLDLISGISYNIPTNIRIQQIHHVMVLAREWVGQCSLVADSTLV